MRAISASRRERILVAAAFFVLGLLRLATLAPDPWEWDEVLFTEGVRSGLDIRLNHPHAPGYPVFIRLGQGIRALGAEPFRATTLAGALGGWLSALALYLLLRELGSRRAWALVGALFYALTPAVWLHGVRPLSDGPGAAAALFAALFLVRAIAGKGGGNLVAAAALTGLAAGVRPQVGVALLPAAAVAAFAVAKRERSAKPLLLAVLAALLLSLAIWIPAVRSSGGLAVWRERFEGQMSYVATYDRPKPADFARIAFWKRWWLDPVGHGKVGTAFLAIGLAGLAVAPRPSARILLVFAPVAALTLGVLSTDSAPRYVLAFWMAPCALAALALERAERVRFGKPVVAAAAVFFLAAFAALGAPSIVEVATRPSPSVASLEAVRASGIPGRDVSVCGSLRAHADWMFRDEETVVDELVPVQIPPNGVLVCADDRPFGLVPQRTFTFESERLGRISRGRYLRAEIYEGGAGAGIFAPFVTGPGWQEHGRVQLFEHGSLTVRAAAAGDVAFSASADGGATVDVTGGAGGARRIDLGAGREEALAFHAVPDDSERLFGVSVVRGSAVLDAFRIVARRPAVPSTLRVDDGIPASIDEPSEGARVAVPFRARGWCQERGGGRVDPVQFRLDGALLPGVHVTRSPRPGVAVAIPEIGDASAAGWEAVLEPDVAPGRHVLVVTFQAGDRRRVYPPRTIEIVASPAR